MATCPHCHESSQTGATFTVTEVLEAQPVGTWSLAGVQAKVPAQSRLRLAHEGCGWSILGHLDGGEFVGDPSTQVIPPA